MTNLLQHLTDLGQARRMLEKEAAWSRHRGDLRAYLKARDAIGTIEQEERRRITARPIFSFGSKGATA